MVGDEDSADSDDEEANANAMDLKGLAETDPEFFSFLQVCCVCLVSLPPPPPSFSLFVPRVSVSDCGGGGVFCQHEVDSSHAAFSVWKTETYTRGSEEC